MSQFLWTGSRTGIRTLINFHNKRWDRDFVFGADDTSITNQQQKTSHIYTCQYMYQHFCKILEMLFYKLSSSLLGFLCFSKFAIWFKWKAKQNQLKFIFPMLFCISYKFFGLFSKHNINVFRFPWMNWIYCSCKEPCYLYQWEHV